MITKEKLESFEQVRNTGKYNMISDVYDILSEPIMQGITRDDYMAIINFLDNKEFPRKKYQ